MPSSIIDPTIPALAARGFLSSLGDLSPLPSRPAGRDPTPLTLQQALAQDPTILLARRQQEEAEARKGRFEAERAGVEAYEATFKQLGTQMGVVGKMLVGVDSPDEWDLLREMLDKTDPGIRQTMSLPDAYDPVALEQGREMTLSGAEYFTKRAKAQAAGAENPKYGLVLDLTAIPEDATDEEKAAHWSHVVELWSAQGADPRLLRTLGPYTPQGYQLAKRLVTVAQQSEAKKTDEPKALSLADLAERYAQKIGKSRAADLTYDEAMQVVREEAATRPIAPVSLQAIPTPAGIYSFDPRAGAVRPAVGGEGVIPAAQGSRTGGIGKRLESDVATINVLIDLAQGIKSEGDKTNWPGVGGLGYGWAAEQLSRQTGLGSDEGRRLRGKLANLFAEIAKLRGGTALTPTEWSLLDSYVPNFKESVPNIKTKLDNIVWFLDMKKQNLAERHPELLEQSETPRARKRRYNPQTKRIEEY